MRLSFICIDCTPFCCSLAASSSLISHRRRRAKRVTQETKPAAAVSRACLLHLPHSLCCYGCGFCIFCQFYLSRMWICSLQTQGQKQRPKLRPTQPLSHSSRASKIEPKAKRGHERDMPSCERERSFLRSSVGGNPSSTHRSAVNGHLNRRFPLNS